MEFVSNNVYLSNIYFMGYLKQLYATSKFHHSQTSKAFFYFI